MTNAPFCVLVLIVPKSSGSVDIMLIYREYLSNYSVASQLQAVGFFPSSVLFVSLKTNNTFARRTVPSREAPSWGSGGTIQFNLMWELTMSKARLHHGIPHAFRDLREGFPGPPAYIRSRATGKRRWARKNPARRSTSQEGKTTARKQEEVQRSIGGIEGRTSIKKRWARIQRSSDRWDETLPVGGRQGRAVGSPFPVETGQMCGWPGDSLDFLPDSNSNRNN